jgi:hypothetical protein
MASRPLQKSKGHADGQLLFCTPKPFGFSYTLMVSVGQEKNEKA